MGDREAIPGRLSAFMREAAFCRKKQEETKETEGGDPSRNGQTRQRGAGKPAEHALLLSRVPLLFLYFPLLEVHDHADRGPRGVPRGLEGERRGRNSWHRDRHSSVQYTLKTAHHFGILRGHIPLLADVLVKIVEGRRKAADGAAGLAAFLRAPVFSDCRAIASFHAPARTACKALPGSKSRLGGATPGCGQATVA